MSSVNYHLPTTGGNKPAPNFVKIPIPTDVHSPKVEHPGVARPAPKPVAQPPEPDYS